MHLNIIREVRLLHTVLLRLRVNKLFFTLFGKILGS